LRNARWLVRLLAGLVGAHCVPAQVITTVAGTVPSFPNKPLPATTSPISAIDGLAFDSTGNVYISDAIHNLVMRVTPDGTLSVVAGNGVRGYSGDGGPAVNAALASPEGIAIDSSGNLYVADSGNNRIRKVSNGIISTVAGNGRSDSVNNGDGGPATSAQVADPFNVAVDQSGNLYMTDLLSIRKVSNGIISTIAGNGRFGFSGDNGPATNAMISNPGNIAFDSLGNLYFADKGNNRIRKVANGIITTVAGNGTAGFGGDNGSAINAMLNQPYDLGFDASGNFYIADLLNNRVRKVSAGIITTVAGNGSSGLSGDNGPATAAALKPARIAVLPSGIFYVGGLAVVRKVVSGVVTTVAGAGGYEGGDGGPATLADIGYPYGIAVDAVGDLFIAGERIREVSNGIITTAAGSGATGYGGDNGPAGSALVYDPDGVAVDVAGNLYIADTSNNRIRKVAGGIITTIAGNGTSGYLGDNGPAMNAMLAAPESVAVDASGNLYIADTGNNRVRKISGGTITTVAGNGTGNILGDNGPAASAVLSDPNGVAVDRSGNVYIADSGHALVRKISNGIIATVAGGGTATGEGIPAASAQLNDPWGVAVDSTGAVYVSEYTGHRVRKIVNGIISTVAGNGAAGFGGDGGRATNAELLYPSGIAVDSAGNLYIADTQNSRIREVLVAPPTFQISSNSLSFAAAAAGAAAAVETVTLTSSVVGLNYSASSNQNWLTVAPSGGTMPAVLQITADPSLLPSGPYTGTITITAPDAAVVTQTIAVSFSVGGANPGKISLSSTSLAFSLTKGAAPGSQQITVSNQGAGSLRYSAVAATITGGGWLTVSGGSGVVTPSAPSVFSITANPGSLDVGTYSGSITVFSSDSGQLLTVPATMAITAPPQKILLSQLGFTFTAVAQGGAVPAQSLGILNTGAGELDYNVKATTSSGSGWLSVSSTSGTVARPFLDVSFVDVSIDAGSLPAGTYYGQIQVSSTGASNSPQTALVVLTVLPAGSNPGPDVRPRGLVFTGVAGGESPGSQNITVTDLGNSATTFGSSVAYVGAGSGWISYLPTNATVAPDQPVQVVVQPSFSNLASGAYRSAVTLLFDDGNVVVVNILAVIAPAGSALDRSPGEHPRVTGCTATKLLGEFTEFGFGATTPVGYPAAVVAKVLDDCGSPTTSGSVTVSFDNGDVPLPLVSLQNGTWENSWQPVHATSNVTMTLSARSNGLSGTAQSPPATLSAGQAPPILSGGPLAAATQTEGPLAPGDIVLIKGASLADGVESATSASKQLAGASVAIGSSLAQLLYADSSQIVGLVPADVPLNSQPSFVVSRDASLGFPSSMIIAAAHPAILSTDGSGRGQGAIYKLGGALPDGANPVKAGDPIVIYCTGLGLTDANGVATNTPAVTISGARAPVSYAGVALAQNYPSTGPPTILGGLAPATLGGLYQINATVPAGLPTGPAQVIIASAGQTSQSGVTMTIAGSGSGPGGPSILAGGIVNAASYAAVNGVGSPVAPGSLVAIFTSALSAQAASFTTATLPPALGGVSVTFGGFTAPMVQVVPTGAYPFVSAQVPFEALPAGQAAATVPVVITVNNVPSATVQTQIVATQPGIFTLNAQGTGQAVLVNLADYTIAAFSGSVPGAHPIPRGQSAFFYVTGLGAMTPSVADGSGSCPAANGLCNANAMPTVFVGGVQVQPTFAGQAPGYPGVGQINLTIPPTSPTGGSVSLVVKSADGNVTSNTATIAVQ
jgi:uncharacterized protein (TIGR03437 family)